MRDQLRPSDYTPVLVADKDVIIIGAGLTGIAASYYLSKSEIPHLIIEKSDSFGGIWSSMTWPGLRCDTEIINYSYSFKPFTSAQCLVSGEVISDYLQATSREISMTDKTVFGAEVEKAVFHEDENKWYVFTNKGLFTAKFLVNANGYFSDTPHIPHMAGIDDFDGETVHLFHMKDVSDLEKKRVALIGSGASAISAAPVLCAHSASLTLLQRSPSYIYEQNNDIGFSIDFAQKLHGMGLMFPLRLVNFFIQLKYDLVFGLFRAAPWLGKLFFKHHWRNEVSRECYEENFRPDYNPWEQRIPVAIGFKECVRNREIDIVTGRIEKFVESGILLEDGRHIGCDLCVLATGFNLEFFKFDVLIGDQAVNTQGINFYKGMMMGGIPNYFQPFGPPHTSFTRRIEVVSQLVVKIILHMRKYNFDTVTIDRKNVKKAPRITPGYVMRNLSKLPSIYGTLQLPSIDSFLFYRFRKGDYRFSGGTAS